MAHSDKTTGLTTNNGIELLTFGSPNGTRVAILLEELKEAYGRDYTYQSIDLFQNANKEPWYTSLNPNGLVPIIVDHDKDKHVVMEGIAIFAYLTRHYDPEHKFHLADPLDVSITEQWMAWQHAGLGPTQAQANFYYHFCPERHAFPTYRFVSATERLYNVLDARLTDRDYIAGSGRGRYSIADIASWSFIDACAVTGIELETYPNVYKWWERISTRPAVQKGVVVPSGVEFQYGYRLMTQRKREDPQGWEEREGPLREALVNGRKRFGYVEGSS